MSKSGGGVLPLLVVTAAFAVGIAALVLLRGASAPFAQLGSPAPDFELATTDGGSTTLAAQRGKVVFVNFWATWCPPCRDEAPSLERLYRELRDEGFEVLAVSVDAPASREEVEAFEREFELSFPVLLDPGKRAHDAFGVTGVPETYLIDRGGRLQERYIGPRDWDDPRFARAVRRLLAAPDAGAAASGSAGGPAGDRVESVGGSGEGAGNG